MADSTNRRTVNATRTSFALIETLAEFDQSVGVTELASELGLPKSTAYKHLKTLCELGYVQKDGTDYELGIGLCGASENVRSGNQLYITAKHHIDTLAEVTDEVAGIVVEEQGYAIDMYRSWPASGPHPYGTNSRYLHCSAPGKAILSALSDSHVEEIVEQTDLPTKTDRTLSSYSELRNELDRIAERGIAFERGEQKEELRSVAVPVTVDERVLGAVYVAGNVDRMKSKRFEEDIPGIIISTVKQFVPKL